LAGRGIAEQGRSIWQNLLSPLQAELLLALTFGQADGCSSVSSCRLHSRMPWLMQRSVAVALEPMLRLGDLTRRMEALPHWDAILRAYGVHESPSRRSRVHCERSTHKSSTADAEQTSYQCTGIYMGNSIFAPVLGSPRLNVLRQLHDLHRCIELIHSHERRSASPYTHVLHSRMEYVWLAPHPPMSMFSVHQGRNGTVWVPRGEDYFGGLNDRHAVMSRRTAEIYFRRWDYILDGSVMQISRALGKFKGNGLVAQDEFYLRDTLRHFDVRVNRFPVVQFLGCCGTAGLT
jgi:hypothetical protein